MDVDEVEIFLEQQGLSDESIDDILEHFGVKGQKWGVRKETSGVRKEAKSDVKNLRKLKRQSTKGIVAKRKEAKQTIDDKSKDNPVYAKAAKKAQNKMPLTQKAGLTAIGALYAAKVVTSPEGKQVLLSAARSAGKIYRRVTESEVNRFLRKNAYTHVSKPGETVVDISSAIGALGMRRPTYTGFPS